MVDCDRSLLVVLAEFVWQLPQAASSLLLLLPPLLLQVMC
jgi:hypothetical protein